MEEKKNIKKQKPFRRQRRSKKQNAKAKDMNSLALPQDILDKLLKFDVKTLEDLLEKTEKELMKGKILTLQNMGVIKKALNDNGLRLSSTKTKKESKQRGQKQKAPQKKVVLTEAELKIEHEKNRPTREKVEYYDDIYVEFEENGKWGFKDKKGNVVIPAQFDNVYRFKEDLCCVEIDKKFGYIDRQGNLVIEAIYDCAMSFSEGYACVFRGEKCGYIDKYNNVKVDFNFDAGTYMIDGNCRVRSEGKWGELHINDPRNIRWII
ncbi:MAG TPA: WG repeat-containing protein [Clostridiales bacterium]|nr:WG repeat-containing protein [Clostridiales bacterium]